MKKELDCCYMDQRGIGFGHSSLKEKSQSNVILESPYCTADPTLQEKPCEVAVSSR